MDKLIEYIEQLERDSFEHWTEEEVRGYLTACVSIKERAKQIEVEA
jgi:hypothetical protein